MNKTFTSVKIIGSVFALILASAANAVVSDNLVVNGDFETLTKDGYVHSWGVSDLYEKSDVVAWGGNGTDGHIELWTQGENTFAELNADWSDNSNWSLNQKVKGFDLAVEYNLSFDYKARQNDDEEFDFRVKNSIGLGGWSSINDHDDTSQWYTYEGLFTASATNHLLQFRAVNNGDTYGNFIDNVSITRVVNTTNIPEPGALFLFGLALVGLGFVKKMK